MISKINKYEIFRLNHLFVPLQRPLFLPMLHNLLLHCQSLPPPDGVHVHLGNALVICFISEMSQLLFSGGDPERVGGDHLEGAWSIRA